MTSPEMTPGDLAEHFKVSDRTVRRMAIAYEAVHGPLPLNARKHRTFTPEVIEQLKAGIAALRSRPGASMEQVLMDQRDGVRTQATRPAPDSLALVLEELRAVRGELADLRALVLTLRASSTASTIDALTLAAPVDPDARERPLTPKPAELLERMKAGSVVAEEGGKFREIGADGIEQPLDPRTLKAVKDRGLITRGPDGIYRAVETLLLTP